MAAKLNLTLPALALGVLMLTGGATGAQAAEDSAKAEDTSKRVCRNIRPTGSRMTTRVCKTADQWQRDTDKTQKMVMEGNLNGSRRDGEFNFPR